MERLLRDSQLEFEERERGLIFMRPNSKGDSHSLGIQIGAMSILFRLLFHHLELEKRIYKVKLFIHVDYLMLPWCPLLSHFLIRVIRWPNLTNWIKRNFWTRKGMWSWTSVQREMKGLNIQFFLVEFHDSTTKLGDYIRNWLYTDCEGIQGQMLISTRKEELIPTMSELITLLYSHRARKWYKI